MLYNLSKIKTNIMNLDFDQKIKMWNDVADDTTLFGIDKSNDENLDYFSKLTNQSVSELIRTLDYCKPFVTVIDGKVATLNYGETKNLLDSLFEDKFIPLIQDGNETAVGAYKKYFPDMDDLYFTKKIVTSSEKKKEDEKTETDEKKSTIPSGTKYTSISYTNLDGKETLSIDYKKEDEELVHKEFTNEKHEGIEDAVRSAYENLFDSFNILHGFGILL